MLRPLMDSQPMEYQIFLKETLLIKIYLIYYHLIFINFYIFKNQFYLSYFLIINYFQYQNQISYYYFKYFMIFQNYLIQYFSFEFQFHLKIDLYSNSNLKFIVIEFFHFSNLIHFIKFSNFTIKDFNQFRYFYFEFINQFNYPMIFNHQFK